MQVGDLDVKRYCSAIVLASARQILAIYAGLYFVLFQDVFAKKFSYFNLFSA